MKPLRILVLLLCASCATPGEEVRIDAQRWVGKPFSDLQAEMKKPTSYVNRSGSKVTSEILANGNRDYGTPISAFCTVHWEVDKACTIVGYTLEGEGCN